MPQAVMTKKPGTRKPRARRSTDPLDSRLLTILEEDAWRSSTKLAKQLKVSAATIRRRMKRLIGSGALRIVGVADPARLGYPLSVVMTLDVTNSHAESVMEVLARKPEIGWISATTGPWDVMAIARFRSTDFLSEFIAKELSQLEGVKGIQTFVCLDAKNGHPLS